MRRAGQQSNVLNVDPRAPRSSEYIKVSGAAGFVRQLFQHASDDWALSVHTNGHNPKSWLIALMCGIAAQWGPSATLTLHSGGVPDYLSGGPEWRRFIARLACVMYGRIVCVNPEIARTLATLGVPDKALEVAPAFLPFEQRDVDLPRNVARWMEGHSPVLSSAMFFRPEYGFELLLEALGDLKAVHPKVGCVVMGDGEHRGEAQMLIDQAGLGDAVLLTGDLDHEVCLSLMGKSGVFVRPTFMDGDAISVREARALGVPVVASNVGTRPEGVILFEVGNKSELIQRITETLRNSPPRRGGVARGAGVVSSERMSDFAGLTTPSAPPKEASRHLL